MRKRTKLSLSLAGVMLAVGIGSTLPSPKDLMFKTYISPYHDVETTVDYLQYAATMEGWQTSGIGYVTKSIRRDYWDWAGPEVVNVKYCKTEYSKKVLETHPYLANMMPCKATVYQCGDEVCVSIMNAGFMGKFFGVGSIMEDVQKDMDEMMKLKKWFPGNGKIPKAQNRDRGKILDPDKPQGYQDGC